MADTRATVTVLVVLVAGLVAAVPLTGSVVAPSPATDSAQAVERIDECTTITEPGRYELASDVGGDDGVCLHVQSSDVAIDGNGNAIVGSQTEDSVGVFVYAADRGEGVDTEDTVENVTVENVVVAEWADGVRVGDISGIDTQVRLRDVTVRDNTRTGVYVAEAEGVVVDGLTATGNGDGLYLWEVQDSVFADVTATDNDERGVALLQDVYDVTLWQVTATGNGNGDYSSGGLYASTDVRRNHVVDGYFADNEGAGVRFSDSGENVLTHVVVESNAGPGIHGIPANDETLRNVSVRDNDGPELRLEEGRLSADRLTVGGDVAVSFFDEPLTLERADAADVPAPSAGTPAVERGLSVSELDSDVDVTFRDVGDAPAELWVYDGTGWQTAEESTYDASKGSVSGTVSTNGLVVPVQAQDDGDSDDGDQDDSPSTFIVSSTRADHNFGYIFVVDGDAEGIGAQGVSADSEDTVIDNGDGTVTVIGATGNEAGDAFRVTGTITEFYTPADPTAYALELDGEDVTDDIPEPNE